MGLDIDGVHLLNPILIQERKPIPARTEPVYEKPITQVYVPVSKKRAKQPAGGLTILALISTIGALILYSIPCILINMLGAGAAIMGFTFGIFGAIQNRGRTLAIVCIVLCVLLSIASIVARWFLGYL
jgi:hypothetical protein